MINLCCDVFELVRVAAMEMEGIGWLPARCCRGGGGVLALPGNCRCSQECALALGAEL